MSSEADIISKMRREIEEKEDKRAMALLDKVIKDFNREKEARMTGEDGNEKFMVNFSFSAEDAEEARYFIQSIVNWVNAIPNIKSSLKLEKLVSFKDVIDEISSFNKDKNSRLPDESKPITTIINNNGTLKNHVKANDLYRKYFETFDSLSNREPPITYPTPVGIEEAASVYNHKFNLEGVEFSIGSVIDYQKEGCPVETGTVVSVSQQDKNFKVDVINITNGQYGQNVVLDLSKNDKIFKKE